MNTNKTTITLELTEREAQAIADNCALILELVERDEVVINEPYVGCEDAILSALRTVGITGDDL